MIKAKNILPLICCLITNITFAQDYIPYYPSDWEFKTNVDLVDFSQVQGVTTKELTIDENKEYPVFETYLSWNSTYQLTYYKVINHPNKERSFNVQIHYANSNGNQLKSVRITNPNTRQTLEEWQYTNGSFDVEKISVKRYLMNIPEPDMFEVVYEGNDDDYTMETVYTPQKTIARRTRCWYQRTNDGGSRIVKKTYLDPELMLDQTDSLILDKSQKKLAYYAINYGIATETRYIYKTRNVKIAGDEYAYKELERIQKDGKDNKRYEYEYDAKGNWIVRKIYQMKNGKWEYTNITRREIDYR